MISEENLEGSNIAATTPTNAETTSSILAVSGGEITEIPLRKTAANQREQSGSFVETSESLINTTVLDEKELVYTVAATGSSNTVLSLGQNDALNSAIVPANITETNVNFETQTVFSTPDNNSLAGFISTSQKDDLTADIRNSVMEKETPLHDQGILSQSEDLEQNLRDLPPWAARLNGCERIGDSYRGYVYTEGELDLLLSMHKEHTSSTWGTRQSPSSQKPSVRFMWKSQYVPYDGIPFLNSGRRATVMECQYGPRRKGSKVKKEYNVDGQPLKRVHRPTCPARIYIKRVRKFPEYKIDGAYEGTPGLRLAQERALTALRVACLESKGEERFYVQFPLEIAHEYHYDDDEIIPHQALSLLPTQANLGSSRLDPRVVEKINELVARGLTDLVQVKHHVINFVEKDLFFGSDEETPARHNKLFFPTITDLQNRIHQAHLALEAGTLQSLPPLEIPPTSVTKDERSRKRKRSEPRRVRTSKSSPLRTICIHTDDPLELVRDPSLQDEQGQVYVMVPSASGLFTNSESLITGSLDSDKATSLVQVLTVPASSSSAFLEQQADGALDLTGQFLALPVMNQGQITTSESRVLDSLGKGPIAPVIPVTMGNTLNENPEQPTLQHTIEDHIQSQANSLPAATISMSTHISPSTITIATQMSPSSITMVSPGFSTVTSDMTIKHAEMRTNINVNQNENTMPSVRSTDQNQLLINSCNTVTSDLVMTSSNITMTSPAITMPSSNEDFKPAESDRQDLMVTTSLTPTTSSEMIMSSSASITSLDMPTSLECTKDSMLSSKFIITSPENPTSSKILDHVTTTMPQRCVVTVAGISDFTRAETSVVDVIETTPSLNELFGGNQSTNTTSSNVNSSACSTELYNTSVEQPQTESPTLQVEISEHHLNVTVDNANRK